MNKKDKMKIQQLIAEYKQTAKNNWSQLRFFSDKYGDDDKTTETSRARWVATKKTVEVLESLIND